MGSRCHPRLGRPVRCPVSSVAVLVAVVAALGASDARAQGHPDAGAPRHAARVTPPASEQHPDAPMLKSIPNPASVLSDSVRARLQERAAARHPSELAAAERSAEHAPSAGSVVAQSARQHAMNEALQQGAGHQRRVQALDTGDGVTVLSNRSSERAAPRLAALAPAAASSEPEPILAEREEQAGDESSRVTETRSLRALSSRREVPKARERSLGVDWLIWPFVLLLATGAVVGTLWFSKKTE